MVGAVVSTSCLEHRLGETDMSITDYNALQSLTHEILECEFQAARSELAEFSQRIVRKLDLCKVELERRQSKTRQSIKVLFDTFPPIVDPDSNRSTRMCDRGLHSSNIAGVGDDFFGRGLL